MARTKASVGAKISAGKSSKVRSTLPPSSHGPSSTSEKSSRTYSGGNPVCPRETPKWQKPITNFFIAKNNKSKDSDDETDDVNASSYKPKFNVIESDDEEVTMEPQDCIQDQDMSEYQQVQINEDVDMDTPKNCVLDETIELEPLTGENSHKIDEYYTSNGVKGKGKGKKSNKENMNNNIPKRYSVKRDLESITFGEESQHIRKRAKVN